MSYPIAPFYAKYVNINGLINNYLTMGKIYKIIDIRDDGCKTFFKLEKDDTGTPNQNYFGYRFEKIDTIKLKCIDNINYEDALKLGNIYEASIYEWNDDNILIKIIGFSWGMVYKTRFEIAPDQNYTIGAANISDNSKDLMISAQNTTDTKQITIITQSI